GRNTFSVDSKRFSCLRECVSCNLYVMSVFTIKARRLSVMTSMPSLPRLKKPSLSFQTQKMCALICSSQSTNADQTSKYTINNLVENKNQKKRSVVGGT